MPPMVSAVTQNANLAQSYSPWRRQGACRHGVNRQGIERFREQLLGDSF
jgi:hypothetical protein